MGILQRINDRCMFEAHWRCAEPVVVIESDDWGLERRRCWEELKNYGQPTEWALEDTETPEDLKVLYATLAQYRDSTGRPACFTANFIMSNVDFKATAGNGYTDYVDRRLGQDQTLWAYQSGIAKRCFRPQYHGLRHLNTAPFLRDLRSSVPGARALFESGCGAALSLIKGNGWRYHSEYIDWSSGTADDAQIRDVVRTGTGLFEGAFGFQSTSTIPPHYVISEPALREWAAAGIRYVQGCNYRIFHAPGGKKQISGAYLGKPGPYGLTLLSRNVKLEPRPDRRETASRAILEGAGLITSGVPVVIDTHRINYTGIFRENGIGGLRHLLDALSQWKPQFLTAPELGEAVAGDGCFRDAFTGEQRRLTPLKRVVDPAWRKASEWQVARH